MIGTLAIINIVILYLMVHYIYNLCESHSRSSRDGWVKVKILIWKESEFSNSCYNIAVRLGILPAGIRRRRRRQISSLCCWRWLYYNRMHSAEHTSQLSTCTNPRAFCGRSPLQSAAFMIVHDIAADTKKTTDVRLATRSTKYGLNPRL